MSNDAQVDSAKDKPMLTPRPTMDPMMRSCMGDWKPTATMIVTDTGDDEAYESENE